MKKLLLISIVMVAVGLGLILYSDPIITIASGNGHVQSALTTFSNPNGGQPSSGGGPVFIGQGTGPNNTGGPSSGGFATMEYLTIAGIAFCGVGIFLNGVEAVSRSVTPQTKTVT